MPKIPATKTLAPFWTTADKQTVRLYQGNVTDVLSELPAGSVHCITTSPPYWALRSYLQDGDSLKQFEIGSEPSPDCGTQGQAQCGRCFVCAMVKVFREVRRVLRDDGVLWLNLGDSYNSGASNQQHDHPKSTMDSPANPSGKGRVALLKGLKAGNLCGIPWRVALALQADGWVLRSDIPWVKRSSMPESTSSRPCKALEYIFLLTKSMRYYFDMDAIRKVEADAEPDRSTFKKQLDIGQCEHTEEYVETIGRNFRQADLWFESVDGPHGLTGVDDELVGLDVTSESYAGAHFATFGKRLITPLILAGTSEHGCCIKCGAPWKRIVEKQQLKRERPNDYVKRTGEDGTGNSCANSVAGVDVRTIGWEPTCTCHGKFEKRKVRTTKPVVFHGGGKGSGGDRNDDGRGTALGDGEYMSEVPLTTYVSDLPLDEHPVKPCVVLDPFVGSGTTCCVSLAYSRHSIGIDLSEKYLKENCVPRIEGELLSRPALTWLAGRETESVVFGADV